MARQSHRKSPTSAPGHIRIISGRWRGRKLPVLDSEGLRPTTDRIKEMLFNWLQGEMFEARCLDLFTGSGGLSFEALSRGASFVQCFELDSKTAIQLEHNRQKMSISAETLSISQGDALTLLSLPPNKPFDLVFIDPPFHKDLVTRCCKLLDQSNWLAQDALVYIETEVDAQIDLPQSWSLIKQKHTGQVLSTLYRVGSAQGNT